MTQTTKTLRMTFTDENDKKINLTIANAKENLTAQEVRSAMETISKAQAFEKEGVDMYHKILSAAYVEHNVTSLFDDSSNTTTKQA